MTTPSVNVSSLSKKLPDIPEEFFETLHNLGMVLLVDDIHDLGYFSYRGRNSHYYRGKQAPDHPSPFHHWQVALVLLTLSQVGGLFMMAKNMIDEMAANEPPIRKRRRVTVGYNDYLKEMNDELPEPTPKQTNKLIEIMPKFNRL